MDIYKYSQRIIFSFLLLIILLKCPFIVSQYLLEDSTTYVDRKHYPNYYINNDNKLKKCDYPCYECSSASDENNQNCLSCVRGYEFDSTLNSCIKCPKDRYKYIYSSYNTCINSTEEFCKKELTKCTLLTDESFQICPLDLPIFIESKKMCLDIDICNHKGLSNEICQITNIYYLKSREMNPKYILNDEQLKNKHNLGLALDKYGNILFEACDDFDEYRYYFGIKKNGNANFTDNNKPTYSSLYANDNSGNKINKNGFILLDFDSDNIETYFVSFLPKNISYEFEPFTSGNIKNKCLYDILKETGDDQPIIENYTISSTINSLIRYNYPEMSILKNFVILNFIGVNNINEYSLFYFFTFLNDVISMTVENKKIEQVDNFKRTSLCVTDSYIVIILYLNINHELKAVIITYIMSNNINNEPIIDDNINNNHYFSCLHLFEETILFIYFKDNKLILSLKNITSDIINRDLIDYNEDFNNIIINIEQKYFISPLYYNNEAIKINAKKFVIISKYDTNDKILILLFELYNKEGESVYKSINVRYYELSLATNNIEIQNNLQIFLFKGLLGIYFYNNLNSFPGFMIFSYSIFNNATNSDNLFNEENNFKIKIKDYIIIENNIFGFEPKIKILSLPDSSTSGIYLYDSCYRQINENETLDITDTISLGYLHSPLVINSYILQIVTISKQPSLYSTYNFFPDEIETFGEKISQENDYLDNIEEFECQEVNLTFEITENNSNECDSSCKICNNKQCFFCLSPSYYPAELKSDCYSISSPPGNEYYFNNTINIFKLCHKNCDTCYGSYDESTNNHNCINCKPGFIKMEGTNNCYEENDPPLSYYKSEEVIYKRCDWHCQTCSSSPSNEGYFNCTSCYIEDNYTLFNKSNNCLNCFYKNKIADYEQKKCIYESEIGDGYYLNEDKIVEKCYQGCRTCSKGDNIEEINNETSINMNCDSCDNENNYFFIYLENNNFYNCYLENEIPKNYYKIFDLEKNESIYNKCYDLCGNCSEGGTENDMKCGSCLNNDEYELINGNCFKLKDCSFFYIRNKTNNYQKECLKENEICIEDYPFLFPNINECKINCILNELINKQCLTTNNPNAFQKVHNIIVQNLKGKIFFLDDNNNFNDIIIEGIDSFFHLTTNINQTNDKLNIEFKNLSHIDLGECENKLKNHYNLKDEDPLFIFMIEIMRNDTPSRQVEFEVYNPFNLSKNLDLSICKNCPIRIKTPFILNENQFIKYQNAKKQGYDIFNPNDTFYNDVCTPFDNENYTDVIINDRKSDYYENINFCESNCQYQGIITEERKVKCSCEAKTEMNLKDYLESIHFEPNKLKDDFFDVSKNSNLKVLKCYKLVLNFDNLKRNIGFYLLLSLSFGFLFSIIYTIFILNKRILNIISIIFKLFDKLIEKNEQSSKINKDNKDKIRKSKSSKVLFSPPKSKRNKTIKKEKQKNNIIYNDNNIIINNYVDSKNNFKDYKNLVVGLSRNNKLKSKTSKMDLIESKDTLEFVNKKNKSNLYNKKSKKNRNENKISKFSKKFSDKNKSNKKNISIFSIDKLIKTIKPKERYKYLIDEEMNHLLYLTAKEIDFRNFFQYYWALLKEKQLIIFTFFNHKDYNVGSLKISLFICSFTIYFTVNTFFFNDDSMHNIYKDKGTLNLNYQIIKILISSGISTVFNMIFKLLALIQKNILSIKRLSYGHSKTESKNIYNIIKIKFIIFIIIGIILLLFSLYYISAFCCVFENSQLHLIKSIFISFIISMLYPLAISIIPAFLRTISLKDRKNNRKCLYDLSKIASLI